MSHLKIIAMDSSIVERLERARVRFLFWRLIFAPVCLGCLIAGEFLPDEGAGAVVTSVGAVAGLALLVVARWRRKCFRAAERDKGLEEALDNEMYESYSYKAVACGFYAMAIFALALYVFLRHVDLPWRACVLAVLFVGVFASDLRLYLYCKRG